MIRKVMMKVMIPPISRIVSFVLKHLFPGYEKVIFVASTGRSGTGSISRLFASIDDVCSLHEPEPVIGGATMIEKNKGNEHLARKIYTNVKSNVIRLERLTGKRIYFESNHMFIKSFIEYAVEDFGNKVTVIHLYRNPVSVAKSLFDLQMIPGTERANEWYLDYKGNGNQIRIAEILDTNERFAHDFYKCLWYWYEIEARVSFWKNRYKEIRFVDFKTEDLNKYGCVTELLQELGIKYDEKKIKSNMDKKFNLKVSEKVVTLDVKEAQVMHQSFREMLKEEGYGLQKFGEE